MAEPKYIKDLKDDMKQVAQSVSVTEKAIVRIDTTLAETLPEMKKQLEKLNGSVRRHDTAIALQKQAHDDCPARKSQNENPGEISGANVTINLSDPKTKIAIGGVVGAPALLLALELFKMAVQYFSQ